MTQRARLDPLTSIRFFAAAMIVVLHSQKKVFNLPEGFLGGYPLDEGVALFFVLSGFIMSYVYPELPDGKSRYRFMVARVARIMPLHLFLLVVLFVLMPADTEIFIYDSPTLERIGIVISNALLVQSWIPFIQYYFGTNGVTWSISTEMFFYIAFLFLVTDFKRSWAWKILAVYLIWILIFIASRMTEVPGYERGFKGVTTVGLLYVNPIARLPEFVTGMIVGLMFHRLRDGGHVETLSRRAATILEVACITMVIGAMGLIVLIKGPLEGPLRTTVRLWLGNGGVAFFWAALVLILAVGRGHVSRWLCHPWLVRLGEVSFAIYLCHDILLRYYVYLGGRKLDVSPWIQFPVYCAVVLVTAHALWRWVELPSRRWLVGRLTPRRE